MTLSFTTKIWRQYYKMIGNAVPVQLAQSVAAKIKEDMDAIAPRRNQKEETQTQED